MPSNTNSSSSTTKSIKFQLKEDAYRTVIGNEYNPPLKAKQWGIGYGRQTEVEEKSISVDEYNQTNSIDNDSNNRHS